MLPTSPHSDAAAGEIGEFHNWAGMGVAYLVLPEIDDDPLDAKVISLEAEVTAKDRRIAELEQKVADSEKRIADLEEKMLPTKVSCNFADRGAADLILPEIKEKPLVAEKQST